MTEQLDRIEALAVKLNDRLYGQNGFEGDIPEIKRRLEIYDACLDAHEGKLIAQDERWSTVKWLVGLAVAGGATGVGTSIRSLF